MIKIPCLFERDFGVEPPALIDKITNGCEWVAEGDGVATLKWDGTACLINNGKLYRRYDAKKGKVPPAGFVPAQSNPDPITGHFPGWLPVGNGPDDQWHREVLPQIEQAGMFDGTYELVGPKINGNPYRLERHQLKSHLMFKVDISDRSFAGLNDALEIVHYAEGFVFHHPDGRMAKIRRKDYGLQWPVGQ